MITTPNRELARKRPAQIVRSEPVRPTVDGEIVARPLHLWRVAGWIATVTGAVLFAGFLLSMLQQYS